MRTPKTVLWKHINQTKCPNTRSHCNNNPIPTRQAKHVELTLRHVHKTIVAMKQQYVLNKLSVFVFLLPLSSLQSMCTKLTSVASLAVPYFSILSHKWQKCVHWFSPQLLSETLLILIIIQQDIMIMYLSLNVTYKFLSDFSQTRIFQTDFRTIIKYQNSWKSVQLEPSCSMQTDRHDKANGRFLAFVSPCIVIYSYSITNKMHLFYKSFILVKRSTCSYLLLAAGSSCCLTNACCRMCSFELLMMDRKTVQNMYSVLQE